jgi:L-arabinose isomerase
MHTFSPAKMWIGGLSALKKPFVHLHTQYNRSLPWSTIDMDFMNLNQAAHGDREFGYIVTRMGLPRKVIVGFWEEDEVLAELSTWTRAAAAWHDAQGLKIARFGDNMRDVAVTEGDKVEAQIRLGYTVKGYGMGDLAASVNKITDAQIDKLITEYEQSYDLTKPLRAGGEKRESLREAAKIELGLRAFLEQGNFHAFTDTFEDLHGVAQLPGIAVQRLMAEGYGFGAEGDWKTAALVRAMKVMGSGLAGGTSFMEAYTYDFGKPDKALGAHMLEVCPSIADGKPSLEIHPLSIGGKADPVRAVFNTRTGPAIDVSLVDLGHRFRMILNEVDVVAPRPTITGIAGGPSGVDSQAQPEDRGGRMDIRGRIAPHRVQPGVRSGHLQDFAEIAGIEFLRIGKETNLDQFKDQLRWNNASYSRTN